jgi:hypothetical protein
MKHDIMNANVTAVGWWLSSLQGTGLESCVASFKSRQVDGAKLLSLTVADTTAMGLGEVQRQALVSNRTSLLVSNALAQSR